MALAKQYYSSYKSNNNIDYYCEIWVKDFSGNASEISLGSGGPLIKYDTDSEYRFSTIISSSLELPFVIKGSGTEFFITQIRTEFNERDVYIHLYKATSSSYSSVKPLWSGFLVMDLGAGEDVSFPYEQKLVFVDGLSLLKDIDFVDLSNTDTPSGSSIPLNQRTQGNYDALNMFYGPGTYINWIRQILKKCGASLEDTTGVSKDYAIQTAVNWYNGSMPNVDIGTDPLALTKCIVSMFHTKDSENVYYPQDCYSVLKELLRHWGARITYWKGEFWIVQIPEYITTESGALDSPININSRSYTYNGVLLSSKDNLGSQYVTRYSQNLTNGQINKLTGTKYNYLPIIKEVNAKYLSLSGNNYYGGFPYGNTNPFAPLLELFQGRITDPSTANFIFLSIPLDWIWNMGTSTLTDGHTEGWWCSIKFNFYSVKENADGTLTTFYLQQNQGDYFWVDKSNWTPLGSASPKYVIKSKALIESNYIGFQNKLPFVDGAGNNIEMLGDWNFYLDIEDYGTSNNNPGSFFCRFAGYDPSVNVIKRNPTSVNPALPDPNGGNTNSGTVAWSNTLEAGATGPGMVVASQISPNIPNFDAGTTQDDSILITSSAFKGYLQAATTTANATVGIDINTIITPAPNNNSEIFSFGTLLWGDAIEDFALGSLKVLNSNGDFIQTDPNGKWGRGVLNGEFTFSNMLVSEFLSGQVEVIISPSMRLTIGVLNKNETIGTITRPRYINPIGILREFRDGPDPVYFFRRGVFYTLTDEWDYEGYQIIRKSFTSTTINNTIGGIDGGQTWSPAVAKIIGPTTNALMFNSPIASISKSVPSLGSDVAVNGNFNVAVGWSLGAGWLINTTTGRATFTATGSVSELSQGVLTQGKPFQINFTINLSAGSLLVKAGTAGTSLNITSSGIYSIYLDCEGSNVIKFEASTTFTGDITGIHIADQKSLTSLPINSLGKTVFKAGDTFNLINSNEGEPIVLTVSSNQGATDTAISVNSTLLYEDISVNSTILINQDDLSAQYQNKTKGTVAGFDITSTGIEKSSIKITDWLNSDTMTGAAVTNVPTALSVKNYVDNSHPAEDQTLQEVTDNGNTTTNSVMIGSSSSPSATLHVIGNAGATTTIEGSTQSTLNLKTTSPSKNNYIVGTTAGDLSFRPNGVTSTTLKANGNLLIGTTVDSGEKLQVNGSAKFSGDVKLNTGSHLFFDGGNSGTYIVEDVADRLRIFVGATEFARFTESSSDTIIFFKDTTLSGSLTGTTATFSGDLTTLGTLFYDGFLRNRINSKLILSNDTNKTEIHSGGTTGTIFKNNGNVEKMRLTSGGKLGVNQSNPVYTVDIGGTLGLRGGGLTTHQIFLNNGNVSISGDTGNQLFLKGLAKVAIYTNNSQRFYIEQSGAAFFTGLVSGITPTSANNLATKSYVDAQVGASDTLQEVTDNGNSTNNNIILSGSSSTTISSVGINNTNNFDISSAGIISFTIGTEKMRLDSTGRLGVGLTNPSGLIHAKQTANDARIIVETDSNGSNSAGAYFEAKSEYQDYHGLGLFSGTSPIEKWFIGSFGSSYFSIINGKRNDGTKVLNVTTDNRVGIGTTNPQRELHIHASNFTDLQLTNDTTGSGAGDGSTISATNSDLYINNKESANILFYTANTERARITSGGNLLLGTTSEHSGSILNVTGGNVRFASQTNNEDRFLFETGIASAHPELKIYDKNEAQVISINANPVTPSYFNSGSNFGIGTTSPSEVLEVIGYAKASTGFKAGTYGLIYESGNELNVKNSAYYGINFHTNNSQRMKLTNAGNLLLGTTVDSGIKLVVNSSTDNVTALFESTDAISEIRIKDDSAYTRLLNSAFTFKIMPYNGVEMMALDGNNEHITIPTYDGTNQTGTATYLLGTDANGKILKTTTIPSGSGGPFLPLTGGTLTGALTGTTGTFSGNLTTGNGGNGKIYFGSTSHYLGNIGANVYLVSTGKAIFDIGGSEKMRLATTGELLLGQTSTSDAHLVVNSGTWSPSKPLLRLNNGFYNYMFGYHSRQVVSHSLQIYANSTIANINWNSGKLKIGTQAYSDLEFYTNDTTKMTLTASSRLGIGTTNPASILHLRNTSAAPKLTFEHVSGGTQNASITYDQSGQNQLYITTDFDSSSDLNRIYLQPGGETAMTLRGGSNGSGNAGNVGIGTIIPTCRLMIIDSAFSGETKFHVGRGADAGISITDTDATGFIKSIQDENAAGYGNLTLMADDTGNKDGYISFNGSTTERARITSGGNLLIGNTVDSGNKLQVTTSNNNDGFRLNYPSTNSTQYPFYIGTSSDSNYVRVNASKIALKRNGAASTIKTEGSSNDLILQSQRNLIFNTNEANEKARITSGGYFGLGTTSPVSKLNIVGTDNTSSKITITNTATSPDNTWSIHSNYNSQELIFTGDNTEVLILKDNGTAYFNGQVTIPAVPVAITDAASKGYVDAQIGANDSLEEVTNVGNSTSHGIVFTSTNFSIGGAKIGLYSNNLLYVRGGTAGLMLQNGSGTTAHLMTTNHIFEVGSAEKMRLTSGGELCVGYTSNQGLTAKFLVNGNAYTSGEIYANGGLKIEDGSFTAPTLRFTNDTNTGIYRQGTDNVGIAGNLTVKPNSDTNLMSLNTNNNAIGDTASIQFNDRAKVGWFNSAVYLGDNGGNKDIKLQVNNAAIQFITGNTLRAYLTSGGNLLIGTTSDNGNKLQVSGIVNVSDGVYMRGANSAAYNGDGTYILDVGKMVNDKSIRTAGNVLLGGSLTGTTATFNGSFISVNNSSGNSQVLLTSAGSCEVDILNAQSEAYLRTITNHDLHFRTNNTNKMVIKTTGKVGIGTVSPDSPLEILSTSTPQLRVTHTDNTYYMTVGHNGTFNIVDGAGSNKFDFRRDGTSKMVILTSGNVLIGSTSDNGQKLQVTGKIKVSSWIQGNSDTNTLFSSISEGIILQTPGNTANNNDSKIYFKNSSTTVKHTFDTNNGNVIFTGALTGTAATFSGDVSIAEKLIHTGDANTYIQFASTNDKIILHTNGGNALTINALQNATFSGSLTGTTATFNGNLKIQSPSTAGFANISSDNNGPIFSGNGDNQFYTNNAVYVNRFFSANKASVLAQINNNGNFLLNSTSDNGQKLQVTGNVRITGSFQVANTGGYLLADTGGSMRYGLKYGAAGAVGSSNLLMLTNRSLSSATGGGEVAIAANASTTGVTETEVMRIKANTQSQVSIDGVLSLTSQNTPADPPNRASTIWLDSNYDLKIKITNNSGVTVTKTLAEYS